MIRLQLLQAKQRKTLYTRVGLTDEGGVTLKRREVGIGKGFHYRSMRAHARVLGMEAKGRRLWLGPVAFYKLDASGTGLQAQRLYEAH